MYQVPHRPWPEMVSFYRGLVEDAGWPIVPMLRFVEQLAASPYVAGLYGFTSHAILNLSQHAHHDPGYGLLRVEFPPDKQRFTFDYFATPYERPHWHATAAPDEGFSKLEHFLRMQGWFVTYADAASHPRPR